MTNRRPKKSIAVFEDQEFFREGLRTVLRALPSYQLVYSGHAADFVSQVRAKRPDFAVIDTDQLGAAATSIVETVVAAVATSQIVALSMLADASVIWPLINAGVAAFCSKSIGKQQLKSVLEALDSSGTIIVLGLPRGTLIPDEPENVIGKTELFALSKREREVLACLADGLSNREIARRLFISEATVKRHLANVFPKISASSRLDAVMKLQAHDAFPTAADARPRRTTM